MQDDMAKRNVFDDLIMVVKLQYVFRLQSFISMTKMIELHGTKSCSTCRSVFLTLEMLDLPYEYIMQGYGHMTQDFVKMNPQKNFPLLKDGDFVVLESRAIMTYLVQKYGGLNHKLYPIEPVEVRTAIDSRLYFDMGVLFKPFADNMVR